MHVAAPIRHGNEIIGVLTIAKPNRTVAPFIARSQRKIMLYGALLMGGAIRSAWPAWWLVVGLRRSQRYARAIAAGERADMPLRGASELAGSGRAVESMHQRLEDRQYVETYIHTLTHEMKARWRQSAARPNCCRKTCRSRTGGASPRTSAVRPADSNR